MISIAMEEGVFERVGVGVLHLGTGGKATAEDRDNERVFLLKRAQEVFNIDIGIFSFSISREGKDDFFQSAFFGKGRDAREKFCGADSLFRIFFKNGKSVSKNKVSSPVSTTSLNVFQINVFFDNGQKRVISGSIKTNRAGIAISFGGKTETFRTLRNFFLHIFYEG